LSLQSWFHAHLHLLMILIMKFIRYQITSTLHPPIPPMNPFGTPIWTPLPQWSFCTSFSFISYNFQEFLINSNKNWKILPKRYVIRLFFFVWLCIVTFEGMHKYITLVKMLHESSSFESMLWLLDCHFSFSCIFVILLH
jgi:hypothetical protein